MAIKASVKGGTARTVFYIVGPSSSGKSTSAIRLSKQTGIPYLSADQVYLKLKNTYSAPVPASDLIEYRKWDSAKNFGIESWGEHAHIDDAKVDMYRELIGQHAGDLIFEGFTLSFASERRIVENVMGPHRKVIVRLVLSYDDWSDQYQRKFPGKAKLDRSHDLRRLNECFEPGDADVVLEVTHPSDISVDLLRPYMNP